MRFLLLSVFPRDGEGSGHTLVLPNILVLPCFYSAAPYKGSRERHP